MLAGKLPRLQQDRGRRAAVMQVGKLVTQEKSDSGHGSTVGERKGGEVKKVKLRPGAGRSKRGEGITSKQRSATSDSWSLPFLSSRG
jgi:hypothetical protein